MNDRARTARRADPRRPARLRRGRHPGRPAAARAGRRPGRARRRARRAGRGRRTPPRACPRDVDLPEDLFTTDAEGLVARGDVDVVVEVIGGIEPARSLILTRARARRLRRHGQQGAARRGRRHAVRRRREGRARPLLRGRRRRRHPDPAAAARVARRRPGHPGARHRQRHHQLHPRQDGHLRRRVRRGARGGPGARVRRGRPDRRRRGLRRRRQGRDPGQPGLPHPGHRSPTCTARASPRSPPATSPRPREMGCVVKLLAICALENGARRPRRLGPRAPGDDPARRTRWPASARPTTRCSWRARPPAS